MADPYLIALMQGEISLPKPAKKDKFDLAAEKYLKKYLEEDSQNKLESLDVKNAKLLEELKFAELDLPVASGVKYLVSNEDSLDPELYAAMLDQFSEMKHRLKELDLESPEELDSWSLCVSQEVLDGISNVAVGAYHKGEYSVCLSLFALLTTLEREDSDYWLKLGISALKIEDFDLALKAFDQALKKDSSLVEAHLFSPECYLKKGRVPNAKQELEEIQKAELLLDEVWNNYKEELEKSLPE